MVKVSSRYVGLENPEYIECIFLQVPYVPTSVGMKLDGVQSKENFAGCLASLSIGDIMYNLATLPGASESRVIPGCIS